LTIVPVRLRTLMRLKLAAYLSLAVLAICGAIAPASSEPQSHASGLQDELEAAAAADKAGDYETAASRYQSFLDKVDAAKMKPQALAEIRTRLATLYFLLHRYPESLRTVGTITGRATEVAAAPAQAWVVEGLDDLELSKLPEAIQALHQALKLNPASGTARLALGDALARSGNLDEAAAEYKEQLRRTPEEAEAWYKLGLAYGVLSKQVADEFLRLHPQDSVARQLEAETRIAHGSYPEALRLLFPVLQKSPSQAGLYADLGMALLGLGFPGTAEAQFRKELSIDPLSPEARFGLLAILSLRGDWPDALEQLRSLAGSNPRELTRFFESPPPSALREPLQKKLHEMPAEVSSTHLGAAWKSWLENADVDVAFLEAGNDKACSAAPTAAESKPGVWLSEACYRQLEERLGKAPGASHAERDKLAEAQLRSGDASSAQAVAGHALKSQAWDGWAMYWLVRSYDALGYEAFRKVSMLSPDSARTHQMMAKYYSDQHETAHAVAEYAAALKLSPDMPDLYLGLGTVYWVAGDWDRAEPPLRKALELEPSLVIASYELGDVYVRKRQWEAAVRKLGPALRDPTLSYQVCLDLAKAEAALGRNQDAVDYLLRAAQQDQDGELHYRLALLYRKIGDSAKAEAALAASNQLRQASTQFGKEVLETMEKERQALEQPER